MVILPFGVNSTGSHVAGAVLAESLAVRLAAVRGLTARAGGGGEADYEVRGEIATREGRLVLATRLHHPGQEQPIWSATFWRKDSLDSSLVSDLTIGIAEAIYSALAREAAGERRKAP